LYILDTDQFRKDLKTLEASEEGIVFTDTHTHNTTVTIAGSTQARTVLIITPYSVEFEDGQYSVQLEESNNNIWSVGDGILEQNQVQVIPTNSFGLIEVNTAGTVAPTQQEIRDALKLDPSAGAPDDDSIDSQNQQAIDAAIIF
jgi:hypothetical protein